MVLLMTSHNRRPSDSLTTEAIPISDSLSSICLVGTPFDRDIIDEQKISAETRSYGSEKFIYNIHKYPLPVRDASFPTVSSKGRNINNSNNMTSFCSDRDDSTVSNDIRNETISSHDSSSIESGFISGSTGVYSAKRVTPSKREDCANRHIYQRRTDNLYPRRNLYYQRNPNFVRIMSADPVLTIDSLTNKMAWTAPAKIVTPPVHSRKITPLCKRSLETQNNVAQHYNNKFKLKLNENDSSLPSKFSLSKLIKSKSEGNLEKSEDDCIDGKLQYEEEYGFITWTKSTVVAGMEKSLSPSKQNLQPKKGRAKKTSTSVTSLWKKEDSCTWRSVTGSRVVLTDLSVFSLSEHEREALQKVALARLQGLDLGCTITLPKETSGAKRKRRVLKMPKRKSHSANVSYLLEQIKNKEKDTKDCQPAGLVFGIPLAKCVANDNDLRKKRTTEQPPPIRQDDRRRSSSGSRTFGLRKSSSSSVSSDNPTQGDSKENVNIDPNLAASIDSLSESDCGLSSPGSNLIDALSLSTGLHSLAGDNTPHQGNNSCRQVPHIIEACFHHLERNGFNVVGIFRVGGSKKRTKQLHDDFDSGKSVTLTSKHNSHDVAALLKEYFRELPEPLLTRDLYPAFLATKQLETKQSQILATSLLVSLLPVVSRDTLWGLLEFLSKVAAHSTDSIDPSGNIVPGNKMDSYNLAQTFGPNILHKSKTTCSEDLKLTDVERVNELKAVISVVQFMIDYHRDIFQVSAELRGQVLERLQESQPEVADRILKDLSLNLSRTSSNDTGTHKDNDGVSLHQSPSSESDFIVTYDSPHNSPKINPHSAYFPHSISMSNLQVPNTHPNPDTPHERQRKTISYTKPPSLMNSTERLRHYPRLVVQSPDTISPRREGVERVGHVIDVPPLHILRSLSTSRDLLTINQSQKNGGNLHSTHSSPVSDVPCRNVQSWQQPGTLRHSRSSEWDKESWGRWEPLTSESSDDFSGQETLV